ncbi:Ig-like domain-containing protein, partial [Sphaerisporangium siamense]
MRLSAGGDTALLTVEDGRGETRLSAPATLPKPVLARNTATYPSAYGPGTDLVIEATPAGILQKIVIRQRPATPPAFSLPIATGAGLKYRTQAGRAEVLDEGKRVAEVAAPLLLDAEATRSITTGRIGKAEARLDAGGGRLTYTPDPAFLADPRTTYPVTLAGDPTPWYGPGFPTDAFVSDDSRFTTGRATQYRQEILTGRNNFDGGAGRYYRYRGYIKHDLTNAPFYGRRIINADLRPWNYITTGCGANAGDIAARRVTSDWALDSSSSRDLRWDNQPLVTTSGEGVKGSGVGRIMKRDGSYVYCNDPSGEVYYSIEGVVQAWADGAANYGVQLAAVNDGSGPSNYREYLSSEWSGVDGRGPVLFVEYEEPVPEEFDIAYERDGVPDDRLPTYEELLADEIPQSDVRPAPETVTVAEAAVRQSDSGQTFEVESDTLPDTTISPIGSDPESAPPTVAGTDPASGETEIAVTTPVRVTFSKPVTGARIELKDPAGTVVQGALTTNPAGDVWRFTPQGTLAGETTYQASVTGATDADGIEAAPYSWSFTTIPVDSTVPAVTATDPSSGATEVPLTAPIRATFSEPVTGAVFTVEDGAGTAVPGSLTAAGDGKVWTFTPAAPLAWNAAYTVGVTAARDASGNMMAPYTWSFATVTDHTAPAVTRTVPAKDATGVKVIDPIVVTFGEPVYDVRIVVKDAAGTPVAGTVAAGARDDEWSFTPTAPLAADTVHTAEVSGGRDAAGNTMTGHTWSFTTAPPDTTPPTVSGTNPARDATETEVGAPVLVTFSEPVTGAQITVKGPSGAAVAGTATATSPATLSFVPSAPLAGTTRYTAEVTGAKDGAGNTMTAYTWSFTTGEPPVPPDAPRVSDEYVSPSDETGDVTSSAVPSFGGRVSDPAGRSSTLTVQVEHDPSVPAQGSGLIWSGTSGATASGSYASVTIASGRLSDGWKLRWRARATAGGVNGAWTSWHTLTVDVSKPSVSDEYVSPSDETGDVTSSAVPSFGGRVSDPDGRSSTLTVQVEHDPSVPAQGSGLIWSGTSTSTFPGSYASVTVPSGKLSDGWKLRWRARATAGGVNGAWTDWHTLTVDVSKPSVSDEYVSPSNETGDVTSSAVPSFGGQVDDPDGRSSTLTVQVEHDPSVPAQGSGLIWSGTSTSTFPGSYASVT